MLFDRRPKYPELHITDRQKAAIASKPTRQAAKLKAALPLFADQIHVEPVDVDQVISQRISQAQKTEQFWRTNIAKNWLEVRQEFFAASLETQLRIAIHWCCWRGPRTPSYFFYVVRQYTKPWHVANDRDRKVRIRKLWIDAIRYAYRDSKITSIPSGLKDRLEAHAA